MKRYLPSLFALSCALIARAANADQLEAAVANDLTLTRVLNGLTAPTAARYLPDGRLVIIQQGGQILVYTGTLPLIAAGTIAVNVAGERGLLGLAVDPQFAQSNRLYFYYSESGSQAINRHRVAYATIDPATSLVNVANRTVILSNLYGPANHNGGGLEFGPDGYLYVSVGDTGCNCSCAPGTNTNNFFSTCLSNANGKILRIDRNGNIPATNPLVGLAQVTACGTSITCSAADGQSQDADPMVTAAPRQEIYAWGFRNPWRFSFDSQTGYMWIGDVGEVSYEEITISTQAGEHHGWPYREGMHGLAVGTCNTITPNAVGPCKEPAYEYAHSGSASITGGVFSNHCSWPAAYAGRYWFGDYNLSRVWSLTPNAARDGITGSRTDLVRQVTGVVHFFTGNDGAIYYVTIDDGEIWRIAPASPVVCPPPVPDAGVPQLDASMPAPDATVPPGDASMPALDAMVPPGPDAGSRDAMIPPIPDAGSRDAMVPPVPDAGSRDAMIPPGMDASMPSLDAMIPPVPDAGSRDAMIPPGMDASMPSLDAMIPPDMDASMPSLDAMIPPDMDASMPSLDAMVPPDMDAEVADLGAPEPDSGIVEPEDSGVVPPDDAAVSPEDATVAPEDAAVAPMDAAAGDRGVSPSVDAGAGGGDDGSCSCTSSSSSSSRGAPAAAMLLLLAGALISRRRAR